MHILPAFAATAAPCLAAAAALALSACSPSPTPGSSAADNSAAAIHARALVLDTHLDTPMHFDRPGWSIAERHTFANDLTHVDLPRMGDGGLDGGWWVVYTPQGPVTEAGDAAALAHAERRLAAIHRTVAANAGQMEIARSVADARRIAAAGKRVVFISMENSAPLGEDLSRLQRFYDGGVRMAGPVHSRTNRLADSATGERRWGGLSPLGRQWVAEMNRLGMVIDGSHSSDEAVRQMIALSRTPIILSHSGFKAIFDHRRNVDDTLAREVAASGGSIHINSVFLVPFNNSARRAPLYDQLDRIWELTPVEQRSLAEQWAALDRTERVNDTDFGRFMAALNHCIALIGADHCGLGADWDGGGGVRHFEDVAALPQITEELVRAGHDEPAIRRVLGENALRLMAAAEAGRHAR